jgi:hypothetical protein
MLRDASAATSRAGRAQPAHLLEALTDVVLIVVTSDVLGRAVGLNSWMGAFVKALAARFREADDRLRTLEPQLRDIDPGLVPPSGRPPPVR